MNKHVNKHPSNYIKNMLLPCLTFASVAGIFSAIIITVFKLAAEKVIQLSASIYSGVSANPIYLPLLIVGAALLGLIASFLAKRSKSCRGGGIPTTIAAIRGIAYFKWIRTLVIMPVSALLSFLGGVPLGTEGPCVQIGAAVGDGTVSLLGGKKYAGWRRYMMAGGAASGFSIVTGSPITAILFSIEELHRGFSPLLITVASVAVFVSHVISRVLAQYGIGSVSMFEIGEQAALPMAELYLPLIVGLVCGGGSVLFTRLYNQVDKFMREKLGKLSIKVKFPIIFACVALIGYFASEITGTGHHLIEHLFHTQTIWYMLLIILLARAVIMMISNTAGVTGGIFLPTLAFGAIMGALCGQAFMAIGIMSAEYYPVIVTLGMVSFLGASSRIPITACVFAIEALSGLNNLPAFIIAVTMSFLMVEMSGIGDFTDTVIATKERTIHANKTPKVIEAPLTVCKDAFVVGKELQDILWPASCVVLSSEQASHNAGKHTIGVGDVLTVRYKTYDPVATAEEFEVLVGDQPEDIDRIMRPI